MPFLAAQEQHRLNMSAHSQAQDWPKTGNAPPQSAHFSVGCLPDSPAPL
jgi:hypothetical protein